MCINLVCKTFVHNYPSSSSLALALSMFLIQSLSRQHFYAVAFSQTLSYHHYCLSLTTVHFSSEILTSISLSCPVLNITFVSLSRSPDVPSPPSAIALLHCTGSEMLLNWRAPSWDGGSPVSGYYLDQREKAQTTWREVNVKPIKERLFKVTWHCFSPTHTRGGF